MRPFSELDNISLPIKSHRKISKTPFKVLDAPHLKDDYYLNLLDWSEQNVLAVGLASNIYLWSASTQEVKRLTDLGAETSVSAISWSGKGVHIGIGTSDGSCQIWDTVKHKMVRNMPGHSYRVGAISWAGPIIASGSRDKTIMLRDFRDPKDSIQTLTGHR